MPAMSTTTDEAPSVFRVGGVSYLRIPAPDGDPEHPSFDDATGHVIGHFMPDLPVAGEAGVRPYIYVERVDDTLEQVSAHGGERLSPSRIPRATCGCHLP
jgi:predicted enzyme related to lactoylglutathione lyase